MEEKEFIEEWVQQNREEKRELFGEIGLHDDCINYRPVNGHSFCNACICFDDKQKQTRKMNILQCERRMCYFYEPKKKGTEDGND